MTSYDTSTSKDYFTLLKPRVVALVVFTAVVGLIAAIVIGGGEAHPLLAAMIVLCIALNAGSAGAFNMWYDRDIDGLMKRTSERPIPKRQIAPDDALAFSIFLGIASVGFMGLVANWWAAGLLAFAWWFYSIFYTIMLKRHTPQNIVIGGAAGAFPPLVSWLAVTGEVAMLPFLMFLIIFLWTPPHFWALALFTENDYEKVGVPMMPNIKGQKRTKIEMIIYTLLLISVSAIPCFYGMGWIYGAIAFFLGAWFLFCAIQVWQKQDMKHAKSMFGVSIIYLFGIFLGVLLDNLWLLSIRSVEV